MFAGNAMLSYLFAGRRGQKQPEAEETRLLRDRERMVETQIVRRGIADARVLDAMRKVPRHLFLPDGLKDQAYDDGALPIDCGQTISQPYIVAIMTSLLELKGEERVLEIGSGSGYQTAVLSRLAREVYSVEILGQLSDRARERLKILGCGNVNLRIGDGYWGWEEHPPFYRIIITAAPTHLPAPLLDQLKVSGRLVAPVGDLDQELIKIVKKEEGLRQEQVIPVRFVPMTGEAMRS